MAGMIEVAKATVTIVPNMEGSQKVITEGLTGSASTAGEKAGSVAGSSMSKSIGKAIVGTAVAAKVGSAIADSWTEVDSALDTVAAKTGATGDSLESLGNSMEKVATSIPTDFATAGDAIGEVNTKFKATGSELETLSEQFIKFSTLNNTDVSSSVDTVANTLAAFGEDASNASSVLDAMNSAGQATGISMADLGTSLQNNAAVFTQMGLSVEDAAGVMATLNTAGLTTAQSQTALRTAMKSATADGLTMSQAMAQFGQVMNSNASETQKLQAAYELFGTRAGASIYNAFANGKISAEDFTSSMTGFANSVSTTFEATLDPTDRFKQAMNGLKTIGAELVEAMSPFLTTIADALVPAVQKVSEAFVSLPDGVKTAAVAIAGIVAVAAPVASLGGKIVSGFSGIGNLFSGIGSTATSAAGGLSTVTSSATVAASGASSAASGFSSMAGGALQIVAVGASFALVGAGIKLIADGAAQLASSGGAGAAAFIGLAAGVAALMAAFVAFGPVLTASSVGILAFGAAVTLIGAGVAVASAGIALLVTAIGNLVTKVAESSKGLNSIAETIGGQFTNAIKAIGDIVTGALGGVANIFKSIGTAAKDCGQGMVLMADGVSRIIALNLIDLVASMGTVGSGISKMASHGDKITETASAMALLNKDIVVLGGNANTLLGNVSSMMDKSFSAIKDSIAQMSQAFTSTVFEFGGVKIPHFSMNGQFNAEAGTVPTVNVNWYAKAAEQGALFSSPQIIGVGDASQPEMIVGEKTLYENISAAVNGGGSGDVYVYIGEHQLDAIIQKSNSRVATRRTG